MNIWINVWHNDERIFWKTMNPYRFGILYAAYINTLNPSAKYDRNRRKEKKQYGGSLYHYLIGGGK